jgi:hypothetical protein
VAQTAWTDIRRRRSKHHRSAAIFYRSRRLRVARDEPRASAHERPFCCCA